VSVVWNGLELEFTPQSGGGWFQALPGGGPLSGFAAVDRSLRSRDELMVCADFVCPAEVPDDL